MNETEFEQTADQHKACLHWAIDYLNSRLDEMPWYEFIFKNKKYLQKIGNYYKLLDTIYDFNQLYYRDPLEDKMADQFKTKYVSIQNNLSELTGSIEGLKDSLLRSYDSERIFQEITRYLTNIRLELSELNTAHFEEIKAQLEERAEILNGYSELAKDARELIELIDVLQKQRS